MRRRADVATLGDGKVLYLPPEESIYRHNGSGRTYAATVICTQERSMLTAFGNPCEGMQAVGRLGE